LIKRLTHKAMKILPPGNILQNMYLKERVNKNNWKSFLEIGSGNGYISRILLKKGMSGVGCDLNESACQNNKVLNREFIDSNKYQVFHQDFIELDASQKFDLIISCMVIEHLETSELENFVQKCKELLNPNGTILFLVPASMKYWGIEDEIAGHIKRYEFDDFKYFEEKFNLKPTHLAGLTYPMSNWLFELSNALIKKNESKILELSQKEKTVYTGNRNVPYKTTFPSVFGLFLNETFLYPLHFLQKQFRRNSNALVIYCELQPIL